MTSQTAKLIKMKDWQRKSSMHFFNRNQDAIAASGFVSLGNKMIVDVMASGFEVVCRDTFFITIRARQILSQNLKGKIYREEEIFAAETALDKKLEDAHEYFDTRIVQAEEKLNAAGFGTENIERHMENYETKSVTNSVTQYLDILAKADYYITLLHYLWITGELSVSQDEGRRAKLNSERETRQTLFAITRTSTKHYNIIRRICNGVIEQRKKEREAQSIRDRQHALSKVAVQGQSTTSSPEQPVATLAKRAGADSASQPENMQDGTAEEGQEGLEVAAA